MPFGVKNGPLTYQRVLSKAFRDNVDKFMKIFPNDFIVYSDTYTNLQKLKMCFHKCKKFVINLNPNKCAFMIFSRMMLGFIVSKGSKLLDPKIIQTIVYMHVPTNPQQIQVFNGMARFCRCFAKNFAFIMAPITKLMRQT